jgi:hypothetical protein
MHTVVSSPARSKSFTIMGRMAFDAETGRSRAVLRMPDPDSDGSVEMQVVGDGTVMYMRSSMFGALPGGREWMALDFSFGQEPDTPLPANGDAEGELELLEAVTGDVQKLGKEDVRGVPTTRYRGTVGASESAERLREAGAEDLSSHTEEEGAPLQVEAWIDADGRVRRMRFVDSQPGSEAKGPRPSICAWISSTSAMSPRSKCPSRAKYSTRRPWLRTSSASRTTSSSAHRQLPVSTAGVGGPLRIHSISPCAAVF